VDEIILLLLLAGAFVAIIPTLSLYKIDGDAYAVASFAADALAGLPLNATEPLFGTTLGPGVRMVFNQSLPMTYLWSHLAHIDPITLTATASRAMIALWALLATYTLAKAAGTGSRRFGLFTACIQLLIYLAAPFVRGDNVSLFFFERINADKFMVPVTMLPVVFAFSIRYARAGRLDNWLAAAVPAFAVSTIHPLVAAMLALVIAAFSGLHLLLHVRGRTVRKENGSPAEGDSVWLVLGLRGRVAWKRSLALGALVLIVMLLPCVQLVMARGEAPLAASFPKSLDGWPMGEKRVPALPFLQVPNLDLYGPLPDLTRLTASQANATANPFLIWRFAVNMNRRRLIVFDLDHYISDPSIVLEPPYLLALLLLPLLLWRIRSSVAAQFAFSTSLAVLFVMFNPLVTPLVGSLVMPWILWRLVWVIPYALIIALVLQRLLTWAATPSLPGKGLSLRSKGLPSPSSGEGRLARGSRYERAPLPRLLQRVLSTYMSLALVLAAALVLSPRIVTNMRNLNDRTASPYFFPTPQGILARLSKVTADAGPTTVLADQDLSVTLPAYVANANIVAHRAPTTSEVFPADQQDVALQRLIDQGTFFRTPYLTSASVEILRRYDVRYVITSSGSDIDMQLRLAPEWFEWLMDDQSYTLYAVHRLPTAAATVQGNTALVQRQWEDAEQLYQVALKQNPSDWLALVGLAEVAHAHGRFDEAQTRLQGLAAQTELPILHYRLGQLYAERGLIKPSIIEFDQAQRQAPRVARFHVALGDACLSDGQENCAAAQYEAAVANEAWSDDASRFIAQADLWRQRGRSDRALPLYEQAVALRPSQYNQFVLASAYREVGQFDRAEELASSLRAQHPLSAEVLSVTAAMLAAQNKVDEAVGLYRRAIWLQDITAQESVNTRLALAQLLLEANRLDEASREVERVLALAPYNASGHKLQGDLDSRLQQFDQATRAYQRALQLDPTQVGVYVALSDQLRQRGGRPAEIVELLQTASQINPDEATLLLALGDQLQLLGDTPSAIHAYQSALDKLDLYTLAPDLRPRSTEQSRAFTYARLAGAYEDLGQLEPAMNYYHAAVAVAPDIPWTQAMLGDALRRRNDLTAAEAAYLQAIQQNPQYVDAYMRLADLMHALGQAVEANDLYAQALKIAVAQSTQGQLVGNWQSPKSSSSTSRPASFILESDATSATTADDAVNRFNSGAPEIPSRLLQSEVNVSAVHVLARLYQLHGQTEEAIRLYQQELEQGAGAGWSPTILAQFYKGLGDLYLAQRQPDQAATAYQQAVALDNWWPEARLGLAQALAEGGDAAGALGHLQMAVDIAPGSVEAQLALANALDRQDQAERALAIYQTVAAAHPGNARATLALARAWQRRNLWDQAEQSYRETIAMNADTADAYIGLAELAVNQSHYDEAEALLQQAITVDHEYLNPYIRLFELEQRRGSPERALSWYSQAAAMSPASQTIHTELIDSLLGYGNYDAVLAAIRVALERRPDDAELLLRLGTLQRRLGQYIDAEATLSQARRLNPADSRFYAELAELYLAQGQPQTAVTLYQQAIDLQPGEISYYLAVSQIWARQARFDQALATLTEGQKRTSRPAGLYAATSRLYLQQGKPDLALATLEQGLRELGEDTQLVLALGAYYESRADFEQAEQQYQRALELGPELAAAHMALADLYLGRAYTDAALDQYEQAVAAEPTNPGPYLALASAYRRFERSQEAVSAYTQALALSPTLVEAYTGLAALYQSQQLWDDAQAVYKRGLAIVPTSGQLLTEYAAFLLERGEEEQALTLLDQVARVTPTASALVARAALYAEIGRTEEAKRDLQSALEKEPGAVDALLALGDLYRDQATTEEARQVYQQIVLLVPGLPSGYLRLSELANLAGNEEEAKGYREAARQAEPGSFVEQDQ
jgi:tetratricopeptide (TPR) repeat protein